MQRTLMFVTLSVIANGWVSTIHANSTINDARKYAWGGNIGWINFKPEASNGVSITEHLCSGMAYSANTGWINLGDGDPADGIRYANTSGGDFGVNHDGMGNLSGLAWGAQIGWLNFGWTDTTDPNRPRVDILTGKLSGYVYGANVGWIRLDPAAAIFVQTDSLRVPDTDGDGIADAFELSQTDPPSLTAMNASSDRDGDLSTDREEYLFGTDPNEATSRFDIDSFTSIDSGTLTFAVNIAFTSTPTRVYGIEVSGTPTRGRMWVDSGLGTFSPDPGTVTTKRLAVPAGVTRRFYRVVSYVSRSPSTVSPP